MIRYRCAVLTLLALGVWFGLSSYAQSSSGSSGTIRGSVLDPSGAAIKDAVVEIQNPVSQYSRSTPTDSEGNFQFDNIPFNNYHLTASASGFELGVEDVNVRTVVPVELQIHLQLGTSKVTVNVEGSADLLETVPTTHTDVDRALFDTLPLESQSSSVSSLVTLSVPGIAADSNGLFHGLGDHAENSFSVDGQPITDQQSKVFSNQIPLDSVQSMEVIEGAPPAEYGDKTSVVIVATTRSGLGVTQPHGEVDCLLRQLWHRKRRLSISRTAATGGAILSPPTACGRGRFLDGPERDVMHDRGNEENFFDRVDFKPSQADTLNLNFGFTRSWFQTPNSLDAQNATAWSGLVVDNGGLGPNGLLVGSSDQRSQIRTFNIAPAWTRLLNPHTVLTFGSFRAAGSIQLLPKRQSLRGLYPRSSVADHRPKSPAYQSRRARTLSYDRGIHNIKAGVTYEDTILTEQDAFGIVDPTANAVCLNADGSPNTLASLTDPSQCAGALQPNPAFNPLLGCYDLTRTGPLPASDGCPNSTSALYHYYGHADIRELALFVQDTITLKTLDLQPGAPLAISTTASPPLPSRSPVSGSLTISSLPTPCCASPMPARWKRRSTKTWSFPAWAATTR